MKYPVLINVIKKYVKMRNSAYLVAVVLLLSTMKLSGQDTMYIYKSGVVVNKRAVTQIDSIIFYRSNPVPVNTVTDIDGNVYHTVTIGTQTWMVGNLKTTKYIDGTVIPNIKDATTWSNLTTPGVCTYNNTSNTDSINTYGRLYNWYAVNTNKLCPTDWHVPSDIEWTNLTTYLGGTGVAGRALKEVGTTHWIAPNAGSNITGFTALPAGFRRPNGTCIYIGYDGYWWSSTESDTQYAWDRFIVNDLNLVEIGDEGKSFGFSVRCIKN
jgi:uncharacterized protein (TIGR02145 family)